MDTSERPGSPGIESSSAAQPRPVADDTGTEESEVAARVTPRGVVPLVVPTVTSVNPTSGPTAGGTTVTITGSAFTGATAVRFGANTASFFVNSDTQITAVTPAGTGTVQVTVTTPSGTSSQAVFFTYTSAPTVTGISPTGGPAAGGNAVTITGSGFTGATAVRFGANTASFIVNSGTQITATAPPGSGTVQVTVTGPGGTSNGVSYTYTASAPAVTSLNPNSGPAAGGNAVTIAGSGFTGATAVQFGATLASFTLLSDTQITATAPPGSGTVQVRVTTPAGVSATGPASAYTYVAAPTISSLTPGNSGPTSGGNTVVISGTGFTGVTAVRFGANPAGFVVNSSTQITATAPAGPPGAVQVTVTATGGTSNGVSYFYISAPTVTGVLPNQGPTGGGNTVTITGTNLTLATSVRFGASSAGFTVVDDSQITATPPGGSGTVQVTVTTPGGTSATGAATAYTYLAAPTITSLNPNLGPTVGGASVTINGQNLTFTNTVHFGASLASFSVISDTQVIAAAPPGAAGPVGVTVTTPAGTSAATTYTYLPPP